MEAAFGLSPDGMDFDTLDDLPARIFFLVVSDMENYGLQIKAVARIARLMHNAVLKEALLQCRSSEQVLEVFREEEKLHFS